MTDISLSQGATYVVGSSASAAGVRVEQAAIYTVARNPSALELLIEQAAVYVLGQTIGPALKVSVQQAATYVIGAARAVPPPPIESRRRPLFVTG